MELNLPSLDQHNALTGPRCQCNRLAAGPLPPSRSPSLARKRLSTSWYIRIAPPASPTTRSSVACPDLLSCGSARVLRRTSRHVIVTGNVVSLQVYCVCSISWWAAFAIPNKILWPPYAIIAWLCCEAFNCENRVLVSSTTDSDGFWSRIESVLISLFPSFCSQRQKNVWSIVSDALKPRSIEIIAREISQLEICFPVVHSHILREPADVKAYRQSWFAGQSLYPMILWPELMCNVRMRREVTVE